MASDYITASEIGEYVYCKRVWWLKTQGLDQTNSHTIAGTRAHDSLANLANTSWRVKLIALLLIGISLLTLILIGFYII